MELCDVVTSFINYHGESKETSTDAKYSVKNIKTLVISPNYVLCEYHLGIDKPPFSVKEGSLIKLSTKHDCYAYIGDMKISNDNYVSTVLGAGTNKLQGLQELVIIPSANTNSGMHYLLGQDSDMNTFLGNMLAKKQARTGNLIGDVKKYYPRLRYVYVASDCSAVHKALFDRKGKNDVISPLSYYTKFDGVLECNVKDWYKSTSFQAHYPYDKALTAEFERIKGVCTKKYFDSQVEAVKAERTRGIKEEYEKTVKKYLAYAKAFSKLSVAMQESLKVTFPIEFNQGYVKVTDANLWSGAIKGMNTGIQIVQKNFYVYLNSLFGVLGERTYKMLSGGRELKLPVNCGTPYSFISYSSTVSKNDLIYALARFTLCFTNIEGNSEAMWKEVLNYED